MKVAIILMILEKKFRKRKPRQNPLKRPGLAAGQKAMIAGVVFLVSCGARFKLKIEEPTSVITSIYMPNTIQLCYIRYSQRAFQN